MTPRRAIHFASRSASCSSCQKSTKMNGSEIEEGFSRASTHKIAQNEGPENGEKKHGKTTEKP